jgi:hypothetical protein
VGLIASGRTIAPWNPGAWPRPPTTGPRRWRLVCCAQQRRGSELRLRTPALWCSRSYKINRLNRRWAAKSTNRKPELECGQELSEGRILALTKPEVPCKISVERRRTLNSTVRQCRQERVLRRPRLAIFSPRELTLIYPSFEAANSVLPMQCSVHLVGVIPDPRLQLWMDDDSLRTACLPVRG